MLFRADLRLADNLAMHAACRNSDAVVPAFIYAPQDDGCWAPGAASRWWLHHSLVSLQSDLAKSGVNLIVRQGPFLVTLAQLLRETGARRLYSNQRFEPTARQIELEMKRLAESLGIEFQLFNSSLLFHPDKVKTGDGKPYKVFTPYWNRVRQLGLRDAIGKSEPIRSIVHSLDSLDLSELKLLPKIQWDHGLRSVWTPGEAGAHSQLLKFLADGLESYATGRDRPDKSLVSRLSPHLHFGEISPVEIWQEVSRLSATVGGGKAGAQKFLCELGWREFAYHLLYHFPETPEQPLRNEFLKFPWRQDETALKAWQKGNTGYPIVDAGMRELWSTGWMHNRVRMIVASFLVKDLLIDWHEGARWFWDTLVDADLASNTLGWQWTAGCGADAAPFFRVFNPVLQGEKFDPEGDYVRRWVPELGKLPAKIIHKPWLSTAAELASYGVELGRSYPEPIVEHSFARQRALSALDVVKLRGDRNSQLKKV